MIKFKKIEVKVGRIKTLNPGIFTAKMYDEIIQLWTECVQSFLIAASARIHVETGMSMASLLPLSKTVDMLLVITPTSPPRKGLTNLFGQYQKTRRKSIDAGEKAGRKAFTLSFGSVKQPVLRFGFEIRVFQYLLQEVGHQGNAPWASIVAGRETFEKHFEQNWSKRVPDLPHFIVSGRLKGSLR